MTKALQSGAFRIGADIAGVIHRRGKMAQIIHPCAAGARQPGRRFVWMSAVCLAFLSAAHAATQPAADSTYPARPIRIIVPYSPGGGSDILTRMIGAKLTEAWNQPVVIDNRPGGNTIIGNDLAAKAVPDGYTILLATNNNAILESLYRKLPYNIMRDFAPVTMLLVTPNVLLVHPSIPARTVREFIALAKAKPRQLNYGSSGNAGTGHLSMEMLKIATNIELVHIPFKGGGPAMNSLLNGEAPVLFNNILASVPQVKAGRVVALGVTTSRRSPALPDVPTIAEAGVPGFEATSWFGILAPAATPPAIVNKLNRQLVQIMTNPELVERLRGQGGDPVTNSPAEFTALMRAEIAKWGSVIKAGGIVPD